MKGKYLGYSYATKFGNTLIVKSFKTESHQSVYTLECSVCSEDKELFPLGSIVTSGDSIKNKRCVCGCNPKYKFKKFQYLIKVNRRCTDLNYIFRGFSGEYNGYKTKLLLYNPKTNNFWDTTSIQTFLLKGVKDPQEHFNTISDRFTLSDEVYKERLESSGLFLEGTKFYKLRGKRWWYWCPLCSEDKYVEEGVCSGVFESDLNHLIEGKKSCRCSKCYKWTKDQREFQIREIFTSKGWLFVGWKDGYKSAKTSDVLWFCDKGHRNITNLQNLLKRKSCSSCSGNGFNNNLPASLYIVRWSCKNSGYSCLKYGITNKEVISRVDNQKYKTELEPEVLRVFYSTDGHVIEDCEKHIKAVLGGNYCDRKVLPRGFTETLPDTPEVSKALLEVISTFNLKYHTNG